MHIVDHAFLVTGGGSGLGAACARRIVASGGQVLIADLNPQTGGDLAAQLGPAAKFVATDVCDAGSMQQAVDAAVESFGGLRGLISCAGILAAARVVGKQGAHDLALFSRVIGVNLIGTFNAVRLAAAAMAGNEPLADGERGVIVNTASVAADDGQIGQAAYSASKAGVAGMTLPIARELARWGIRVVAIAPGVFDTAMMGALAEPARESLAAQVPFPPRMGHPDEFAALACHVIENVMLNGAMIRLDGAMRMAAK